MKTSARYIKLVEWSDDDQRFVGQCPGIIGPCCHVSVQPPPERGHLALNLIGRGYPGHREGETPALPGGLNAYAAMAMTKPKSMRNSAESSRNGSKRWKTLANAYRRENRSE
jgi:hypothetical protein